MVHQHTKWKRWTYLEWNAKLVESAFAARVPAERERVVDRIEATPEELANLAGADRSDSVVVVETFLSEIRHQLKPGQGFCDYCSGYYWDPDEAPPFFAMLWFTCLVAYGYPEGEGSFGERFARAIGKSESFHAPGTTTPCLPGLWESVAEWTHSQYLAGTNIRRLQLPLDVGRRTVIGYSHFLAFPNRFDRARLASLLHETDLVGAEPPLRLLLDVLLRRHRVFSKEFQEDLDDFAREYRYEGIDPRLSAFWRAIRHEAISPSVPAEEGTRGQTSIAFVLDDDGFEPFVACERNFPAPSGYAVELFDDGLWGARLVGPPEDRELPSREAFQSGKQLGHRDRRYLKSGIFPLRENQSGVFVPGSGEDVSGCSAALVREAIVANFTALFGGTTQASMSVGWHEVNDCRVVQLDELPPWLTGATWLLPTTELPSIWLVGGIPLSDGFLFAPSFLPRLRALDSSAFVVELPDLSTADCTPIAGTAEWALPAAVSGPGDYLVIGTWVVGSEGATSLRRRTAPLRLRTHTFTNEYKGFPSGEFFQESCFNHESSLLSADEAQVTVTTTDPSQSADTIDFDATARFLGAGVGEMALTRRPGFDWLVVGPKKDPEFAVFIGNPAAPTQPRAARSPSSGDRRHWHKVWQMRESSRHFRPSGAASSPWSLTPDAVRETWQRYRRHEVADDAEPCQETSLDTLRLSPLLREAPDARVDVAVDAIAALSTERRGLPYRVLSDLFTQLLGREDFGLASQLIRAWTEAGLIDEARHAVSGRTMLVARRPRLVLVRRGPTVDATVVGLVTPVTRRHLSRAAREVGVASRELAASGPWQPTTFRVRGGLNQIERLRLEMNFGPTVWLNWPDRERIPQGLDAAAALRTLFTTSPGNSFSHDASWDWEQSRFVRGQAQVGEGVQLSRRMNLNYLRIYVISVDGTPVCWTFQRSWALLAAYQRRGIAPFVADRIVGHLKSTGIAPVYLPLPIARLCILIGDGAAGPQALNQGRRDYIYPFGRRLFGLIEQVVPPAWIRF